MTRTRQTQHPSIRQAREALHSSKPEVAETLCREHLNLHPVSVEHLRLLGHALMQQRRFGHLSIGLPPTHQGRRC